MVNQQLINYIKKSLSQGLSNDQIKELLLREGWSEVEIAEAFEAAINLETPGPAPVGPTFGQEPSPTFSPEPKKSNLVKIIAVVFIVAVLAAGISLASRIWDPAWNPFRPAPEKVIERMMLKTAALKTVQAEGKISLEAREGGKIFNIFNNISIRFSYDFDNTDLEKPKLASTFGVIFDLEGIQFFLTGESKIIGEVFYLKLTTIPLPGLPPSQFIKDNWIMVDEESIKDFFESMGALTPEMAEMFEKQTKRGKEIGERLKELLADKELYLVKEVLPDEEIEEKKVYHYIVALNKKIISELMEVLREEAKLIPPGLQDPDEFLEKWELWIGKKDLYLYKIKFEKEIDKSVFDPKEKGKILVRLEIDYSNFDQPATIEAPREYKTLKEILEEILGPMFPGLPSLIPEDLPQIEEIAELPPEQPFMLKEWLRYLPASILEFFSSELFKR